MYSVQASNAAVGVDRAVGPWQLSAEPGNSASSGPEASDASVRLSSWTQEDCPDATWLSRYGPRWSEVRERIVMDPAKKRIVTKNNPRHFAHKTMVRLPSYSGHVVTEFRFEPRDASDDHDVPDSP